MLYSWHLTQDVLVYQEDQRTNKITHVKLFQKSEARVTHFLLPDDLAMPAPTRLNLESFVQQYKSSDKNSVKNFVRE